MLSDARDAEKVISVIELHKIKTFMDNLGIPVNISAWGISDDPATQVRKFCKALCEHIFAGTIVSLKSTGPYLTLNERQASYVRLALRIGEEGREAHDALDQHPSFRELLSRTDASLRENSIEISNISDTNLTVCFDARLETIRNRVQGNYDYAAWFDQFHTSIMAWRNTLTEIMTEIPSIEDAVANIKELIRLETRRRQAATISEIDNIIASITGETASQPEPEVVTPPVHVPATPSPAASQDSMANVPIAVGAGIVVLNGIRYEVAGTDESRRAEELARAILGR